MYHTLDIYCNNLFLKCTLRRGMCNIYILPFCSYCHCCCCYKQSNWNISASVFYFHHLMGTPTHTSQQNHKIAYCTMYIHRTYIQSKAKLNKWRTFTHEFQIFFFIFYTFEETHTHRQREIEG